MSTKSKIPRASVVRQIKQSSEPVLEKQAVPGALKALKAVPWKKILPYIAASGGGMAFGSGIGEEGWGAPRLFGYADSTEARRMSSALSAATWPTLLHTLRTKNPKLIFGGLSGLVFGEFAPTVYKLLNEHTNTVKAQTEAAKRQIPGVQQITDQLAKYNPELRGAGMGAAVAGLGALGTSSLRRQSDKEKQEKATRSDMAKSDFLKYLLPAVAAGGIGGHLLANRK